MIREYIDEQEGEQVAGDSRFPIDNPRTARLQVKGRSVQIGFYSGSAVVAWLADNHGPGAQGTDAEQSHNRDRRPKTDVITRLYATPDPRLPAGSGSTNVGAGRSCHSAGVHNHRATPVLSHPVWPKASCTLFYNSRYSRPERFYPL